MSRPSGWGIWLTGLPAAEKTTLARALQRRLSASRVEVVVLDADDGEADRDDFYRQLVSLAALLNHEGSNVVIRAARTLFPREEHVEGVKVAVDLGEPLRVALEAVQLGRIAPHRVDLAQERREGAGALDVARREEADPAEPLEVSGVQGAQIGAHSG